MPPSRILDSHIHLWPGSATGPEHHGWMTEGMFLARKHGIEDYLSVVEPKPWGFVYVETDRYLPSTVPDIADGETEQDKRRKLAEWAKAPLEEIKFLRRIVEGKAQDGDGFHPGDGELLKGCVIWAPFLLSTSLFTLYLDLAEELAGPALWNRVVGFRYLLQGKAEGEVKRLVQSESWLENIVSLSKGRGGKGWAFDVGVDTHRDGVETLEVVGEMIYEVRRREEISGDGKSVRFVLSKLSFISILLPSTTLISPPHHLTPNRPPLQTPPLPNNIPHPHSLPPLALRPHPPHPRPRHLHEALRRLQRIHSTHAVHRARTYRRAGSVPGLCLRCVSGQSHVWLGLARVQCWGAEGEGGELGGLGGGCGEEGG